MTTSDAVKKNLVDKELHPCSVTESFEGWPLEKIFHYNKIASKFGVSKMPFTDEVWNLNNTFQENVEEDMETPQNCKFKVR